MLPLLFGALSLEELYLDVHEAATQTALPRELRELGALSADLQTFLRQVFSCSRWELSMQQINRDLLQSVRQRRFLLVVLFDE